MKKIIYIIPFAFLLLNCKKQQYQLGSKQYDTFSFHISDSMVLYYDYYKQTSTALYSTHFSTPRYSSILISLDSGELVYQQDTFELMDPNFKTYKKKFGYFPLVQIKKDSIIFSNQLAGGMTWRTYEYVYGIR